MLSAILSFRMDLWKNAKVFKGKRCPNVLWQMHNMRNTDAQARCDSDTKCLGLQWLNNYASSRTSSQNHYLKFGSDGRSVSEGWFQGCGGEVATAASDDWDTIVKPGKQTTTLCVSVLVTCGKIWLCMVFYGYVYMYGYANMHGYVCMHARWYGCVCMYGCMRLCM